MSMNLKLSLLELELMLHNCVGSQSLGIENIMRLNSIAASRLPSWLQLTSNLNFRCYMFATLASLQQFIHNS